MIQIHPTSINRGKSILTVRANIANSLGCQEMIPLNVFDLVLLRFHVLWLAAVELTKFFFNSITGGISYARSFIRW